MAMTDQSKRALPRGILRVKKPKMKCHRGRTWDSGDVILPSGDTTPGYLDTTWGERFYFSLDGQWYAGRISDFCKGHDLVFDLRTKA